MVIRDFVFKLGPTAIPLSMHTSAHVFRNRNCITAYLSSILDLYPVQVGQNGPLYSNSGYPATTRFYVSRPPTRPHHQAPSHNPSPNQNICLLEDVTRSFVPHNLISIYRQASLPMIAPYPYPDFSSPALPCLRSFGSSAFLRHRRLKNKNVALSNMLVQQVLGSWERTFRTSPPPSPLSLALAGSRDGSFNGSRRFFGTVPECAAGGFGVGCGESLHFWQMYCMSIMYVYHVYLGTIILPSRSTVALTTVSPNTCSPGIFACSTRVPLVAHTASE